MHHHKTGMDYVKRFVWEREGHGEIDFLKSQIWSDSADQKLDQALLLTEEGLTVSEWDFGQRPAP